MIPFRRVLLGIGAAALVAGLPAPQAFGRATADPGPILLSQPSLSWVEGQQRWVTLSITSPRDLDDFSVVVTAEEQDVAIEYEDQSLGRATLAGGPELSTNEVDTVSFSVDPGPTVTGDFDLELEFRWRSDGQTLDKTLVMSVHQQPAGNQPFLMLTDSATVPARGDGARNWVELGFLGLAEDIRDFTVSIEGELPVHYPQRSFTSLHHDAVLRVDERDVARFWLDPSNIEPGRYELDVVINYTIGNGREQTTRTPLTVDVTS